MSSHGRSASYGSGGWFQGTMEVISGMAPRPSTPQGLPSGNNNARSMSAPNSPARPGMIPAIARLPSQDSLDRSIHNESGHGKSTAQIIRDLKHSNAALSAKQASQEAHFMNQLSDVTKSFEEQRLKMDADIRALKKQNAQLEAFKTAADAKLQDKEAALSKVKEESAFQRHNISDLKNQLYQLQSELDDNAGTPMTEQTRQEMEQLLMDNQDMARELARMQAELRDSERNRHELERSLGMGKPPVPNTESPNSSYYHKYQETHSELEKHRKSLASTQTTLEGLKAEKQSIQQAHQKTVQELQQELTQQAEQFALREKELQAQLESLEFTDSELNADLKRTLLERDETITSMERELASFADKVDDLSSQLALAQKAAASQEDYRRDEAEDLRILHDAQEEEIVQLRKRLEDSQREMELRDVEMEERQKELSGKASQQDEKLEQHLAEVRKELEDAQSQLEKQQHQSSVLSSLQKEMETAKESNTKLTSQLSELQAEHQLQLKTLQATIDTLTLEKAELAEELEKAKDIPPEAFEDLRKGWEGKLGASQEAQSLKKEIEIHKQRNQEAGDRERVASEKIKELTAKIEELEAELRDQALSITATKSLETAATEAESLRQAEEDLAKLQQTLEEYENGADQVHRDLHEAQIALVALDDEKREMSQQHRELLAAVEKKKDEITRQAKEQLDAKNAEIKSLKKKLEEAESTTQSLESAMKSAPATPPVTAPKSPDRSAQYKLELTMQTLTKEKEALSKKLKDRDTTIAALVKTSVSLENKISSMEADLQDARSVQSEEKKTTEGEIHELRRTLQSLQDKEPETNKIIESLKRELETAKNDSIRWQRELQKDQGSSSQYRYQLAILQKEVDDGAERLKERDQAIDNMVNQSITQEAHIRELKTRISSLMKEVEKVRSQRSKYDDSALKSEILRLQQETEMFAGQIIEQDEEIQRLRRMVKQRDESMVLMKKEMSQLEHARGMNSLTEKQAQQIMESKKEINRLNDVVKSNQDQVAKLEGELEAAKRASSASAASDKVKAIQAELDELRDEHEDNRQELISLRRQLWDSKQAAGMANDLKLELAQTKYAFDEYKRTQGAGTSDDQSKEIQSLKTTLQAREDKIAMLEASSGGDNDTELASLRKALDEKTQAVINLEKEMQATMSRGIDTTEEGSSADRDELLKEKAALVSSLEEKSGALTQLQEQQEKLTKELTQAKQAREASEKSLVDAYEKRLKAAHTEKDAVIDQLRRDLTESRLKLSDGAQDTQSQLESLQTENAGLREQFEVELQAKNQQIYALEHTLHAQEQIVESMRAEMDQLQSGMEHATSKRRGEVEGLQQELMQLEGRALKQEREITALKMQVEESKLEHKAEVVQLKEVIAKMEQEGPQSAADLKRDDRMLEVRERLEQLKARNTSLQEENLKLSGRLERKVIEARAMEFDKERAEDLDKENASLRQQMKELESIIQESRQAGAAAPKVVSPAPSPAVPVSKVKDKSKKVKGIKGLFKRRGGSTNDAVVEEEEA
eukprot:Nitzschia sp. Nitz4//scaffold481_size5438//445//4998//NITZ4_009224-RA/size5438-processed-gene-0.2-mRNA-1//-1//CDS//3329552871//179//frame0